MRDINRKLLIRQLHDCDRRIKRSSAAIKRIDHIYSEEDAEHDPVAREYVYHRNIIDAQTKRRNELRERLTYGEKTRY